MREETIVESRGTQLRLSDKQAATLRRLGRELASDTAWWGSADEPAETRTVIRCESESVGLYTVRVSDAIGVIGLGDLQITVQPKIPLSHLLFLLSQSQSLPRVTADRAELEPNEHFFGLIAKWLVAECEKVLRRDLTRGYEVATADLAAARGRIDCLATTRSIVVGRPRIRCSYEHFGNDTALNRLLRQALRSVQQNPSFQAGTRQRARRAHARFDDVGDFRPADLNAITDSRTLHYRDAAILSRLLLTGRGTSTTHGPSPGGTFLFRTPEAVEEGIRRLLRDALSPDWTVDKKGRRLPGARARTLNPDLVFNQDEAIGDVKYRLSTGAITRSHLNQVTTFAAGYNTKRGLLIEFGPVDETDHVEVGPITLDSMNWDVDEPDPAKAASGFAEAVRRWLLNRPD